MMTYKLSNYYYCCCSLLLLLNNCQIPNVTEQFKKKKKNYKSYCYLAVMSSF